MDIKEKTLCHDQFYKRVSNHTSAVWAASFVRELLRCFMFDGASCDILFLDVQLVQWKFTAAGKRLILFDYDGTLTPIVKQPSDAVPSQRLIDALHRVCADRRNIVYIISGRDGGFLQQHLGHIQNLGFSAEHGCFLREPGHTEWTSLTEGMDLSWMARVEELFKYYEARTTGSAVERKAASVTFHYRNADPEFGLFQAKECQGILENMQLKSPIDVLVGKKNLEVRPAHTHKGEIVKRLVYLHPDTEFVLCCGDDKTDEDMFRALLTIQSSEGTDTSRMVSPPESFSLFPALRDIGTNVVEQDPSKLTPVQSNLHRDCIFTVAVDPALTRKTMAGWRVGSPDDIVDLVVRLSGA